MGKLVKTLIGAAIGMGIGYFMSPGDPSIILMLAMAGLPSGWRVITKAGIIPLSIVGFIIHLVLATVIGWISLPIELVISVKEVVEKKRIKMEA